MRCIEKIQYHTLTSNMKYALRYIQSLDNKQSNMKLIPRERTRLPNIIYSRVIIKRIKHETNTETYMRLDNKRPIMKRIPREHTIQSNIIY